MCARSFKGNLTDSYPTLCLHFHRASDFFTLDSQIEVESRWTGNNLKGNDVSLDRAVCDRILPGLSGAACSRQLGPVLFQNQK